MLEFSCKMLSIGVAEMAFLRSFNISLENCGKDRFIGKGHVYGPVMASDYIMQYCFAGCGVFSVDGKDFRIKKGEAIVTFPGQHRMEIADVNTPWRNMWLSFRGKSAKEFFERMSVTKENPVITCFEETKIPYLMQNIIDMMDEIAPGRDFVLASKLYEFLDECMKSYNAEDKGMRAKDVYVSHAVNFLELHFVESDITVEKIAKMLGIDRSYFYTIFKESTGLSPKEYLTDLRIKKATELLAIPGASATSVALSVGYEPSVFSKAFKSVAGLSPAEYKKKGI